MRLPRWSWLLALLLLPWPLAGANAQPQNPNVTVLLFRTEQVQRVHLTSNGAILQRCPACPQQRGPVSLDLREQGGKMVDAASHPLRAVMLQGAVAVETGAHHRATVAGRWTIDVEGDSLRVRVEVPRERYVEAVLSAEANPYEPAESLKALAVVARSFAAAAPHRHPEGELCDTTHCQALRFEAVRQSLHDAVWGTSGETLWYRSGQVPAYFSQHCGGFTEDASAAWGGPKQPWLVAHADPWCSRIPSNWHASLAASEVRHALANDGHALPSAIQQIAPLGRDSSGRVQQLRLVFAGGAEMIAATAFRLAIDRELGWNQLRSDRYQVQRIGDRFIFEGSGYGHGVGLCQAGAAAMARAGKSYREILQMYFPGSSVRLQQADAGWVESAANGFVLRAAEHNAMLKTAAAAAFADARARWGKSVRLTPSLTVFPTTEAFRQATGQPGWTLAVTEGSRISTQPLSVLNSHGGSTNLFRHEFLHSFVEEQASASAPLWLREGLVALLNGEPCDSAVSQSAEMVDSALHAAGSLAESQRAHHAACGLAKRYVREHGWDGAYSLLQQR